jgi:hypothetical protein
MSITTKLLATAATLSLTACIPKDDTSGIDKAIPTADQVSIKLPTGQARTIGELADWYVSTRNITTTFNGGSAWVLILLHTIVAFPETSEAGNVHTWGPFTDALNPAEYRLDVTDNGDGTYHYALSGHNKADASGNFTAVISGDADTRAGELQGSGHFLLDFDAGKKVNPIDADPKAHGTVGVTYDLAQRHLDLDINSTDDAGKPVAATYAYNEAADGGGDMVFELDADLGDTPAPEHAVIRSRWLANGSGRADVGVFDGDAGAGVEGSQCWDTMFKSVFEAAVAGNAEAFGFVAAGNESACAFTSADFPGQ